MFFFNKIIELNSKIILIKVNYDIPQNIFIIIADNFGINLS